MSWTIVSADRTDTPFADFLMAVYFINFKRSSMALFSTENSYFIIAKQYIRNKI